MIDPNPSLKCANCKKPAGYPRSICWNCEKALCRSCGGLGNAMAVLVGNAFVSKQRALICKDCYDKENEKTTR